MSGSLLINGRFRLYWELSLTVSVHVSYRLVEYLEWKTHRKQHFSSANQKLLSHRNIPIVLYLSDNCKNLGPSDCDSQGSV